MERCFKKLQVVYDKSVKDFEDILKIHFGSSVKVKGTLISSPAEDQSFELKAKEIILIGDCSEDYPIQPKANYMVIYIFMHRFLQQVIVKVLEKCFKLQLKI